MANLYTYVFNGSRENNLYFKLILAIDFPTFQITFSNFQIQKFNMTVRKHWKFERKIKIRILCSRVSDFLSSEQKKTTPHQIPGCSKAK